MAAWMAVELGSLTLLATGYRDTMIKLKSDNSNQEEALEPKSQVGRYPAAVGPLPF